MRKTESKHAADYTDYPYYYYYYCYEYYYYSKTKQNIGTSDSRATWRLLPAGC